MIEGTEGLMKTGLHLKRASVGIVVAIVGGHGLHREV